MSDPAEVDSLLGEQASRTVSRTQLNRRHPDLEDVSPHVGELDIVALAERLDEDIDAALPLLIDLAQATDAELRAQVKAVAARLLVSAARHRSAGFLSGAARLVTDRGPGVDLDVDTTFERLAESARFDPTRWHADDLRWRTWRRPSRAYVLVIDASGSVTGRPLATALISAAALAARLQAGDELAVVAFWSRAVVLRHVRATDAPPTVLSRLLDLRGGDTTDLALGLRVGLGQAALSRAVRRDVIVLTDGMANEGDDPRQVARTTGGSGTRVHTLAVSDHPDAIDACLRLADVGGGRSAVLAAPAQAPTAMAKVLVEG
ncbi:MAG: VWA domain-containing protein [Actinomycetota bacterium]|nr:VWA domain-containing protein [Actinomycetota bacterium]